MNLFVKIGLGAVFLLIVTPAGFLLRMLGIDFLERKKESKLSSYWKKRA